jgi:hypothetical protein
LFYDPKYVHVRQAWLTRMRYALNKLPIPASLFNLLLSKVGPLHRDSLVVIVNAGAGHLTRGILQKSLPFRKIHAVSHSKGEAKAFKDKVHNKKVEVHFQDGLTPPRLKGVDSFICMADLGYVKNIESYLVQVKKILSKGGKFCFYMGHSFLDMTPNSIVVEDRKKMLAEFKKAGLHADYSKTRRLFKTRILVYGKKT